MTPTPAAVLFVADVPRMTMFYQQLAGMSVEHAEASHAVLEIAGFQLVIHALRWADDASTSGGGVSVREDSYHKLCYPVASIDAARALAASLGGHIQGPEKAWASRGFRACDGHDPEGNVLQVREAAE